MSDDATAAHIPPPASEEEEAPAIVGESDEVEQHTPAKKDARFWLIMVSLMVSVFLSAMDLTSVSVALPTIVNDLDGANNFVWVGSAYSLASTAILPLAGNIATIFGRQSSMLGYLIIFAAGSAVTGSAHNMSALIAGRTVQGLGGGGILAMTEIIVADLVSLRERGVFMGIIGAVWALASAVGPPIGGGLAQAGAWRWLFYLNLPVCAIAFVLVLVFLRLKRPAGSLWQKLQKVDWWGNALIITATTIVIVALVEGGVQYAWNSYQILVPLILGLVGIAAFIFYEARYVKEPTVPFDILSNRTSLSGYAGTFIHGLAIGIIVFYFPVYFQATKLSSPVWSSVQMFPFTFSVAPFAIICGATVAIFHHYVGQNLIAWAVLTTGAGLFTLLNVDTSTGMWVGFQLVVGVGLGILYASAQFAVLAPLPVTKNAHALAFFTFVRSFAQTFGVTIGSTVLQNELLQRLPADFSALFGGGQEISYSAIPEIPLLPQPLQDEVRTDFADSLRILWFVLVGIGAAGFISALFMKQLELHETTDDNWGIEEKRKQADAAGQRADVEKQGAQL